MSVASLLKKELAVSARARRPSAGTRVRFTPPPGYISLGAGDPDFNQPTWIADAVYKAILDGHTHYSFGGEPSFKEAIADYYNKYGTDIKPNQVLITSGGSQGIYQAFAALLNPEDEVILFDPTYGGYRSTIGYFGGKIVRSPMLKTDEGYFRPDLEALKETITDKTKALMVCNPDNPTGCVFTKEELSGIADLAKDHDFAVIADEIYTEFVWGGRKHFPIISLPDMADRTIILASFSKMLAWTGCRAGFIISGPNLTPNVGRVPLGICSMPVPFQKAATLALKEGEDFIKYMRDRYEERIDYCSKRLDEMPGIKCVKPEATFYVFPDISGTGLNSREFAANLAKEESMRITAGVGYGPKAEGHERIALIKPIDVLKDAMDRMERFATKIAK